jgi:hypothetical protein
MIDFRHGDIMVVGSRDIEIKNVCEGNDSTHTTNLTGLR